MNVRTSEPLAPDCDIQVFPTGIEFDVPAVDIKKSSIVPRKLLERKNGSDPNGATHYHPPQH